jgi:hypothetical protein
MSEMDLVVQGNLFQKLYLPLDSVRGWTTLFPGVMVTVDGSTFLCRPFAGAKQGNICKIGPAVTEIKSSNVSAQTIGKTLFGYVLHVNMIFMKQTFIRCLTGPNY